MDNSREINLREEVKSFFDGTDFGNEKFHILLQRKIRLDTNEPPYTTKIVCTTCNHSYDNRGREGCPDCDGVGYLWDEKLIIGYMYRPQQIRLSDQYASQMPLGRNHDASILLITPYKYQVGLADIIYSVESNDNGGIIIPISKGTKYMCVAPTKARLDFNKIEFNTSVLTEVQWCQHMTYY